MKRLILGSCASLALALAPAASLGAQEVVPLATTGEQSDESGGPALWKVEDEDTTIYLFGTVHVLPANVQWYGGDIAKALESADTLVTEIPANSMNDSAMQASVMRKALLPEGKTLRGLLSEDERAQYEAAMAQLGMPAAAFDRFEPWFVGMTMAVLPLMMNGYDMESGVETVVEAAAPATVERLALETPEQQIDFFDKLPPKSQVAFLMSSASDLDRVVSLMDEMLNEWLAGDADDLARLMNSELTDPVLAAVLLHSRNERWAEWIDARMDEPGAVFIAVGAGHLAGEKSVQDYLTKRDIVVTRIQ